MKELRASLVAFLILTVLTGVAYPLLVTTIGKLLFPAQADGSLIYQGQAIVGSSLIGQPFSDAKYLWGRGSATAPQPYNGASSSGSNLGPTNPALIDAVKPRVDALRAAGAGDAPIPVDLVTASGSGLDPHISPAAAALQVSRIAAERKLPENKVREVIVAHTEGRQLGFLGQPRVNVLEVNLALDAMK